MTIDIKILCRQLTPEKTTLLFGAGSSIPSGGLSAAQLGERIAAHFKIDYDPTLQLSEVSTIVEKLRSRADLITFVRSIISPLTPTGSLVNLPLFNWKSIFTTNYDTLIESSFSKKSRPIEVYSCNFDFNAQQSPDCAKLYKIHGTIDKDLIDGHNSRMVITAGDYDVAQQYREILYKRLEIQMTEGDLLIIGHSLADQDLRPIVEESLKRKRESGAPGKIFLLLYVADNNRAIIYEDRGIYVCFGGIDDFFSEMMEKLPPQQLVLSVSDDPLDIAPGLRPSTVDVSHSAANGQADVLKLFNGRPATYADIARNWTFDRDLSQRLEGQIAGDGERIAYVLGAAGVGKTTAARQALFRLSQRGMYCWEHKDDFALCDQSWKRVDSELRRRKATGVLLVDDCHNHMREVSRLIDAISVDQTPSLKVVIVSTKPHWNPRLKTPTIFVSGVGYELSQLNNNEINSLLDLLDREPEIRSLVENRFIGFSRAERMRRLEERCSADMFVCMKNIFGFEGIDDIILREYAELHENYQDIYRTVSVMEAAGVRVHRQLIIRTLGLPAQSISGILENLTGIVSEYTINKNEGLYGWRGRHGLIAEIVASYKFADQDEMHALFSRIIENLNPSYDIEVRTIRDMCDMRTGIGRIKNTSRQNYLLRRMISLAPGERVPRHRLISNLIEQEAYEDCENEIRLFERELRPDAPVHRYRIKLLIARANHTKGLMNEDRAAIVSKAADLAKEGVRQYFDDKNMYRTYCEVGLSFARLTGKWSIFDEAMMKAKEAEERIMDPELRRIISAYEKMAQKVQCGC